jgi:hypothetical protein
VAGLIFLSKPGQSAPCSWFRYAALAILVVSVIYAAVLTRRDPAPGDRVGSIVADEYPSGSLIPGLQRLGAWVTWIRPS